MRSNGIISAAAAVAVTLGLLVPGSAAPSPPSDDSVQLYVQVLDSATPVRGLRLENFEARQRGKLTPIINVTEVDTHQWIFFYDFTFGARSMEAALEASVDLLAGELLEGDRVGVVVHTGKDQVQVLRPTSDLSSVVEALEALKKGDSAERPIHPNADYLVSVLPPTQESGRGLAYAAQARIRRLAGALEDAAGLLGSGESNLVLLFSEAFDLSVAFGNDRTAAIDLERATLSAEASVTGQPGQGGGFSRASGGAVEASVLESLGNIKRGGTSIQSVRLRADESEPSPRFGMQGPEGLSVFAEATGGEVLHEPENLAEALTPLVARTRGGYRLTLRPKKYSGDGRFRAVDVRLLEAPAGVELIAPAGYYE